MDHSSDEDTDISESEISDYEDKSYEKLKNGSQCVKTSDETFTCPYCPKKRKRDYMYKELLQHASGVGQSSSQKRRAIDKANHLALVKYLEKDLMKVDVPSKPAEESDASVNPNEQFVWPWIGIVVNIPTRRAGDGRCVGESGSKLRDEYRRRGFNPFRVSPLWNFRGHTGTALVEFNKNWPGFHNALAFEKAYESDHHGKKDWFAPGEKSGLYAWVSRADDYKMNNIIGENLRKMGDVKTVSELQEEEDRKQHKLVSNLHNIIQAKNQHLKEIEVRCNETTLKMDVAMGEKDKLIHAYNEEIKKIQSSARDHFQRIFNDHGKLKMQLETQKNDLELRKVELEKREAHNESERKKLSEEIEENAVKNSSLQMASMEQQKADENILKLAEDQKRQKEELHAKILRLEKDLDMKQKLELEIEQLQGKLNVLKHMKDDDEDAEVLNKVDSLLKELREKEEEFQDLDEMNNALIAKQRKSNDELQEARNELLNFIKEMPSGGNIGVKRMGELDTRPFLEAMKKKYNEEEAEDRASELCSLWEEYLKDPDWHPFKVIMVEGKETEIIRDDDEKLNGLRSEISEGAYNAVVTALKEINEYNPSGRYISSQVWNYGQGRVATLQEGVQVLMKQWKTYKRKRGMM
ncbi:putative XS domain-containing protein [Lupinus albus]|uniref:Putative XS domain-containing protein n=1 Tax=Lupinus albus TaxID=3870 RepID=A0A6A4NQ10_LUPAL|nr:putative XS domain-containing protein [Lupinus albus]